MLNDDQIIEELRAVLVAETRTITPRPGLLDRVHQELAAGAPARRVHRRLRRVGAVVPAAAVGIALAVTLVALLVLHHGAIPRPAPPSSQVPVGTVHLAVRAPDPHGGLPWGLRTVQTRPLRACLQIGRVRSGRIGAIGQDGAYHNDGRFHPIPLTRNFPCAQTDAHGHLFHDVFEQDVPANAAFGSQTNCVASQPPKRIRHLMKHYHSRATCPASDLRNIAFGVLGPDAVGITYQTGDRSVTEATGPDGAYLVVVPATKQFCTTSPGGGTGCRGGGGEITTSTLQSGLITAVRYRDGHVCHLPAPHGNTVRVASCPNVGYAKYPPRTVPHITNAQVKAPMTIRIFKAKHYCYKRAVTFGSYQIPCDHGIPHGYHRDTPAAAPAIALVDITFTARLAATNHHSVYEFSYGRASGPKNCTLNTGGTDATTMVPIRAGQRVTIQDTQEVCPGTYEGYVTYQPNSAPGRDTLHWPSPIHDHSILVGQFTYTLHRKP